jgi:hypothetical protein
MAPVKLARILAPLLLLLSALQTQASASTATVVIVGAAAKVRPTDAPTGPSSATLFAAQNEFESFQVVVAGGGTPITGLDVSLAQPLTGPGPAIPASNVTIYREGYYDVVTPSDNEGAVGRWPDALIPKVDPWYGEARNAFPIDVPAGENRVAWIDLLVPVGQTPGTYTGSLSVTSADGLDIPVPVSLTVLNFTLPSTSSLPSAFGMTWSGPCLAVYADDCSSHSSDGWTLNALFERVALENRLTIDYPSYQTLSGNPGTKAKFEQYVLPLIDGTGPTRLPGAQMTSVRADGGSYTAAWRDEATAKGFAGRTFFKVCDEPHTWPSAWVTCTKRAAAIRASWPAARILITATIGQVNKMKKRSVPNLIVPVVQHMYGPPSGPLAGNQRSTYASFLRISPRNQVWMYTSCMSEGCSGAPPSDPFSIGWPTYAIDQPASEARAMGWLSFVYNVAGEHYYQVDGMLSTAWTDSFANGGNGDGTLFYPGTTAMVGGTHPIPIESMRLKLIRDGREDYEYLAFLAAHGQRSAALSAARGLFPNTYSTNRSDAAVQSARQQLAILIAGIVGGPLPPAGAL